MEHYRVQERELQWRSRRSKRDIPNVFHSALRRCATLWSAREIASVAFSAERERHAENVFHIALSHLTINNRISLKTGRKVVQENSNISLPYLKRLFQRNKLLYYLERCPFTEYVG